LILGYNGSKPVWTLLLSWWVLEQDSSMLHTLSTYCLVDTFVGCWREEKKEKEATSKTF